MKKSFWIFLLLTVTVMVIIFSFSQQSGEQSADVSQSVTDKIVIEKTSDEKTMEEVKLETEYVLRKIAHFVLYASLGFFAFMTLYYSDRVHKKSLLFIISIVFCIIYASSDEIHQLFIKVRTGSFTDVVLDSAGSLTGVTVAMMVQKIRTKEVLLIKSNG